MAGDLEKQRAERTPRKFFISGSEDNLVAKYPKPPKDNKKRQNKVRLIERGNNLSQEGCEKSDNDNDQRIYEPLEQMYGNDESPSRYFGDSSQLTNWILDSGATCHMTPKV